MFGSLAMGTRDMIWISQYGAVGCGTTVTVDVAVVCVVWTEVWVVVAIYDAG
jgi:hypothetical protein